MKIVGSIIGLLVFEIMYAPIALINVIFRGIKMLYMLARYAICWKVFRRWPRRSGYFEGYQDVRLRNNNKAFWSLCKRDKELYNYWLAIKRRHIKFYKTSFLPFCYGLSPRLTTKLVYFTFDAEAVGVVEMIGVAIFGPIVRLCFKVSYLIDTKIIKHLPERKHKSESDEVTNSDDILGDTVGDCMKDTVGSIDDFIRKFFWSDSHIEWLKEHQGFLRYWESENGGFCNGLEKLIKDDESQVPA